MNGEPYNPYQFDFAPKGEGGNPSAVGNSLHRLIPSFSSTQIIPRFSSNSPNPRLKRCAESKKFLFFHGQFFQVEGEEVMEGDRSTKN